MVLLGTNLRKATTMLMTKKIETMAGSDWHVWLSGGFGAALFDLAINNGKLLQMLSAVV